MVNRDIGGAILPEILSEIFLHFLNDVIGPDLVNLKTPLQLIQLTHICRSWRIAALSTPRMWSRFDLVISEENARSESALLSTWITRSGACPLQIRLAWAHPPFSSHYPALEILAQCSERWEDMLFKLPMLAFGNSPLIAARGNMPRLTRLAVGAPDAAKYTDLSWDIFSIAPKLTSFQSINCNPTSFQILWGQLTHIPAMSVDIGGSVQVLQLSSKLHKANFFHYNLSDSRPYPVVLHSSLKTLSIRQTLFSSGGSNYSDLFLNVTLPNLQSLTISAFPPPPLMPATLTTFLSRITTLDHLSLRGCVIDDTILSQSLEVTWSLTHLDIRDVLIADQNNFLERVNLKTDGIGGSGDFVLVPKLKILGITVSSSGLELFTELVEHRAGTLQHVHLQSNRLSGLDPHLRDRLEKVQSETLSVLLS
ncbi:hypothetical protein BD779DRAFT_1002583 [Infundibulicybe gibba]|nr:hypothetical protein BD779DRAFT_1002583 [Infundibulicybe gibba]